MNDAAAGGLATRIAAAGLDWIVPEWPVPAAVQAFSTTRGGGVSAGAYASLDLGFATAERGSGDDPDAIAENLRRVRRWLPGDPAWLDQVHGADVAIVDAVQVNGPPPRADAAVTRAREVPLAVLAADCLPVVLAARDASVVGIAHAGWRGLARGVVERAVAAMAVAPREVVAWLGPAIGPRAFEVGPDVRDAVLDADPGATDCLRAAGPGKWRADLAGLARRRLARAGVNDVHGGTLCTHDDAARFYSYRRERATGRMATFVWLAATGG